jgi:hypothetical protein
VWRLYTGVLHCVFDQILNLQIALPVYHPKQKPRRVGDHRQINPCRQFPLQVNLFKKRRHLGSETISYLVHAEAKAEFRIRIRFDLH